MHIAVATPAGYAPNSKIVAEARADGLKTGSTISVVNNPFEAAKDADVLYTDVWSSMGQEAEQMMRSRIFIDYQINSETLAVAKPDALVMHCLPAHRGEEITDEAMEGPNSVVFDQAENRLHVQKAILALLMGK
jgi:ornithine carbamoyltransferase